MIMGTLANLYAIQQTFSVPKTNDKNPAGTKDIVFDNSVSNDPSKIQSNEKSTYECFCS